MWTWGWGQPAEKWLWKALRVSLEAIWSFGVSWEGHGTGMVWPDCDATAIGAIMDEHEMIPKRHCAACS